jgi:hypothetical protein
MPTWSLFINGDRIVHCPQRKICEEWLEQMAWGYEHDREAKTLTGVRYNDKTGRHEHMTVSYDIIWE